MAISTTCPNCRALFRLADELAGKKVRCQKCDGVFEVPAFDGTAGTPSTPPTASALADEPAAPGDAVTIAPPPLPTAVEAPAPPEEEERDERRRDDDDDEPPMKRRESRRPSRSGRRAAANAGSGMTAVILAVAGLVAFSCLACGGVGVAIFVARSNAPNPPQRDGVVKVNKQIPPGNGKVNTITANLDPAGAFRNDNQLTNNDPLWFDEFIRQNKNHKRYVIHLEANRQYRIDLRSQHFDAYLYLLDDGGQILMQDDDSGGGLDSQIVYTPHRTGNHQIVATSLDPNGFGQFSLIVQRIR